nr:MAG: ORF1 [TTV-like mini virus]
MAPYQRYWNYYRQWRRPRFSYYRRRRPRKTFRKRRQRKRTVRRRRHFKFYKRKQKKIKIQQWQPNSIKKCHIKGYLCLFQAGQGRENNNYTLFKESYTPEHEPGGGGWSLQQLSLGNLYQQNNELMNYWTKSNYRLNMCRYYGVKFYLFRQQYTDYVFSYFWDAPKNVTKYYYASYHPMKMLEYNRKVVVPSMLTQPHKKKPYKKVIIKPPKLMKTQWFFQQHLSDFPLIYFSATACSLDNMFGSDKSENSNASIYMLNTGFFKHPCFQYKSTIEPTYGYTPNSESYLWGIWRENEIFTQNKRSQAIYLGNSMLNESGTNMGEYAQTKKNTWGNPFHWTYLTGSHKTFITTATESPAEFLQTTDDLNKRLTATQERHIPSVQTVRYNPFKDKGKGNKVYFIPTYNASHNSWEPTSDPDLMLTDHPLWILLWGLEDIMKKMGKCINIDNDWILVIQSSYFSSSEKYYVPLSWDFVHGQGPYGKPHEEINPHDNTYWFPKYRFQRQAVNDIIQTGPAVVRFDHTKNIQALCKYDFFFKWGGNPSPMENVYDPNSQPITPTPGGFGLQNEITNPATGIETFLYPFDIRRDFLTQSATKRITESSTDDHCLFTDGTKNSTDVQLFPQETQTETTPQTQETSLILQLQQLKQLNLQLQQRFNNLKQSFLQM